MSLSGKKNAVAGNAHIPITHRYKIVTKYGCLFGKNSTFYFTNEIIVFCGSQRVSFIYLLQ